MAWPKGKLLLIFLACKPIVELKYETENHNCSALPVAWQPGKVPGHTAAPLSGDAHLALKQAVLFSVPPKFYRGGHKEIDFTFLLLSTYYNNSYYSTVIEG